MPGSKMRGTPHAACHMQDLVTKAQHGGIFAAISAENHFWEVPYAAFAAHCPPTSISRISCISIPHGMAS